MEERSRRVQFWWGAVLGVWGLFRFVTAYEPFDLSNHEPFPAERFNEVTGPILLASGLYFVSRALLASWSGRCRFWVEIGISVVLAILLAVVLPPFFPSRAMMGIDGFVP